jgi:hypothetical protein
MARQDRKNLRQEILLGNRFKDEREAKERRYLLSLLKFCFTTGCILKVDWKCGDCPVDAINLPDVNLHLPMKNKQFVSPNTNQRCYTHD